MIQSSPTVMQRNLRHHLRIPTDFVAHITTRDQRECDAAINNISRTGLMLECDRCILETLTPNALNFAPLRPVCINIRFTLPLGKKDVVEVETEMLVIYTRRLARNAFHVGLQFKELTPEQTHQLEQYIAENKLR
ncbi:PilZ domain-containing protein [Hahella sp. HN01]|nr:PilZ domain-containing protein [Hahella sp. HN01]